MRWIKIFDSTGEARQRLKKRNPLPLRIGERKINLVLCQERIYAVADACPHQHASLSGGWTNHLCEIICPLHEYRFSLESGQESAGRASHLETFPVQTENGLFIGLT